MAIYNSILDTIGDTPMLEVEGVYCKLEYLNPSGSIKARVAKYMVERAENEASSALLLVVVAVQQIEGNIIQGISRTLWEEVKFDAKNVTSVDWMTYPILDITETPEAIEVALVPLVKIPTARRPLGNGKWEGGLLVPIGYAIPGTPFSIAATPEIDWVADEDGQRPVTVEGLELRNELVDDVRPVWAVVVASLGWQATEKLGFSAEIWGAWDWDPSGTTRQASADGTVAYLVNNDLQLDAGANFGLNRETPDVELYAGFSVRF